MKVIVTTPHWTLNGVNVLSTNLVRKLRDNGVEASILVTDSNKPDSKPLPVIKDTPIESLEVRESDSWRTRWTLLIERLTSNAPCVYIPNNDYYFSCIASRLPNAVSVIGILHSDEHEHYQHLMAQGRFWNKTVTVSKTIRDKAVNLCPDLSERIVTIPNGVPVPMQFPDRRFIPDNPLRIMYTGRLIQYQKRIMDLLGIARELKRMQVPFEMSIIGGGPDEVRLKEASVPLMAEGCVRFIGIQPNEKIPELLRNSHVFVLTSEFEGLPISLMEAMAQGCVPVVSDIESGIPELIRDGSNGYVVPIGDAKAFAIRLAQLQKNTAERNRMSHKAYETMKEGPFNVDEMARQYARLFDEVFSEIRTGAYQRPAGPMALPDDLKPRWKHYVPIRLHFLEDYINKACNVGPKRTLQLGTALAFETIAARLPSHHRPLMRGLADTVRGEKDRPVSHTRHADSARYCYTVWMRHLVKAFEHGLTSIPRTVGELGPGSSVGVGLAAILSGAVSYRALDITPMAQDDQNKSVLQDLEILFNDRSDIPDHYEFPEVLPRLNSYTFPHHILTEDTLKNSLTSLRVKQIYESLEAMGSPATREGDIIIDYAAPWHSSDVMRPGSLDLIVSQAVLEHVDELPHTYECLFRWLKKGGLVSNVIDFRCHRLTENWNEHWTYSSWVWRIISAGRRGFLNRRPHSFHRSLLEQNGFEILCDSVEETASPFSEYHLAREFRGITKEDLITSAAHMIARRPE